MTSEKSEERNLTRKLDAVLDLIYDSGVPQLVIGLGFLRAGLLLCLSENYWGTVLIVAGARLTQLGLGRVMDDLNTNGYDKPL